MQIGKFLSRFHYVHSLFCLFPVGFQFLHDALFLKFLGLPFSIEGERKKEIDMF